MKSSFFEYNVAISGLHTARANLTVVSHNLANAEIPGYSRQVTLQRASRPLSMFNGRGMYGTGSEVYGVIQIRDKYLDNKYWSQKTNLGEYTAKNAHLSLVETVFNDANDSGVQSAFTTFFSRLQDLSRPEAVPDATYRTNVISAAETLANLVRTNAEALQKQQRDINQEISDVVSRINSLGTQIASLNKQITQYELDGSMANDLRDNRALLVDQLSEYVNVKVEELDYSTPSSPNDKRFTVMINGYDFVNNTSVHPLVCVPRDLPATVKTTGGYTITPGEKHNDMDVAGLYDLYFEDTGSLFNIYSNSLKGTLKGLIDMRDGNNTFGTVHDPNADPQYTAADREYYYQTTNYKGIPFYLNKLNVLVRTFAKAVNVGLDVNNQPIPEVNGHVNGYDYDGNPGQLFFTYSSSNGNPGTGLPADFQGIIPELDSNGVPTGNYLDDTKYTSLNCLNFAVNPNLTQADGWRLLACSSDPNAGISNNDIILGFGKINNYSSLFKEGKLMDFIIGTTDHLSIDRRQARNFEESYTDITVATDNQRLSVSGVDMNEEMTAMVKYNQLYQACAKLVNVINGIYDTMINRLGLS